MPRPYDPTDPLEAKVDRLEVRITYRSKEYGQVQQVLRALTREPGVLEQVLVDAIQPVVTKLLDDHTEKWIRITPGQDGAPAQMHWAEPPPNQR